MPIDLLNTYEPTLVDFQLRLMHFYTFSEDKPVELRAFISNQQHPFMPDVYNLAFGPPDPETDTGVLDKIKIRHDDLDKLLSTLLLFAYTYLSDNMNHYVGIDGSCNLRAAMYYRKLQANYGILKSTFSTIAGNKYYIRFRRFNKQENDELDDLINHIRDNLDYADIKAIPEMIDPFHTITLRNNFNYFTFNISQDKN